MRVFHRQCLQLRVGLRLMSVSGSRPGCNRRQQSETDRDGSTTWASLSKERDSRRTPARYPLRLAGDARAASGSDHVPQRESMRWFPATDFVLFGIDRPVGVAPHSRSAPKWIRDLIGEVGGLLLRLRRHLTAAASARRRRARFAACDPVVRTDPARTSDNLQNRAADRSNASRRAP